MKDYAPALVRPPSASSINIRARRRPSGAPRGRSSRTLVRARRVPAGRAGLHQVLAATPEDDDVARRRSSTTSPPRSTSRASWPTQAQDYRAAADHFLRIRTAAPTSAIRAAAEYDAGAALIRLEDWTAAAEVLERSAATFPDHELQREATKQIAYAYRESGQLSRAAGEYERIASESEDPAAPQRGAARWPATSTSSPSPGSRAGGVHALRRRSSRKPVETALETRSKIAEIYKAAHDEALYQQGAARRSSASTRRPGASGPAGRGRSRRARRWSSPSRLYREFVAVKLQQPFETACRRRSGAWTPRSRPWTGWWTTRSPTSRRPRRTTWPRPTATSAARCWSRSGRPTCRAAELQEYEWPSTRRRSRSRRKPSTSTRRTWR